MLLNTTCFASCIEFYNSSIIVYYYCNNKNLLMSPINCVLFMESVFLSYRVDATSYSTHYMLPTIHMHVAVHCS